MSLTFYNTLTRKLEPFEPIEQGHVRVYTCGPTIYDFPHIGNYRTFLFEDILRRTLQLFGFRVTQVMNLTDVDDRTIQRSTEAGIPLREYTDRYAEAFFEDLRTLRIQPAEHYPRATDYIPQMVELVQRLEKIGHTYRSDGSIYYRIGSFPSYGKLSGVRPEANLVGARVDADDYEKEDARDFVLWKAAKPGEPSWQTEIGVGRPGWHLECSAMSMSLLGESFDIHSSRSLLAPCRAPGGGRGEDGKTARKLPHLAGAPRPGTRPDRGAISADLGALPPEVDLHLRQPARGCPGDGAHRQHPATARTQPGRGG
jgi:cysteinyl-tRNA synthetase